jgi:hypothetical protein
VSHIAQDVLRQDLERQAEFRRAENVSLNFGDNSVQVDGELNFAESSNVIVKNATIFSLLLAATQNLSFYHPRFALFDNIEDKGHGVRAKPQFSRNHSPAVGARGDRSSDNFYDIDAEPSAR